jgi:hypothetical protein
MFLIFIAFLPELYGQVTVANNSIQHLIQEDVTFRKNRKLLSQKLQYLSEMSIHKLKVGASRWYEANYLQMKAYTDS